MTAHTRWRCDGQGPFCEGVAAWDAPGWHQVTVTIRPGQPPAAEWAAQLHFCSGCWNADEITLGRFFDKVMSA